MSQTSAQAAESGAAMLAKSAPPVSVSIATISGVQVSEIILWGTLLYTVLMIGHKVFAIYRDIKREVNHERSNEDVS